MRNTHIDHRTTLVTEKKDNKQDYRKLLSLTLNEQYVENCSTITLDE